MLFVKSFLFACEYRRFACFCEKRCPIWPLTSKLYLKSSHTSSYHWYFGKVNKSPVVVTDNQVTSNAVKSDDSYSLYRCVPYLLLYIFTSNWMTCQKPGILMFLGLPDPHPDPVVARTDPPLDRLFISVQRTEIMVANQNFKNFNTTNFG